MEHDANLSRESKLSLVEGRKDLSRRLDDLLGLGLLPSWSDGIHVEGEDALQRLALSLIDLLESAQRRVIETSIQLLSLRELIAGLLNMRTAEDVARTLTLYLHKAFDHERVLVGIYDEAEGRLHGWVAVRRGAPRCSVFTVDGDWDGAVRDALLRRETVRSWQDEDLRPFIAGSDLPRCLDPFLQGAVGPYLVYPLLRAQGRGGPLGVLAVARGFGSPTMDGMDAEILASLVDTVATALENVLLEEGVRREEAFRKDIMGSMPSGLIAVDLEGRVLTMNERAETITGYTLDELQGTEPARLDGNREGLGKLLRRTLERRAGLSRRESILARRGGRKVPVGVTTTLLRNPQDEIYGALATFEDLTDLKAMEERIRQLDRLAALGRFTAGVAHEIRNPLAGIAAGVQYLAKHLGADPAQADNLIFIRREIDRLNRIVEDLFRVTHPMAPRRAPENPVRLVEQAARVLQESFADRRLAIRVQPDAANAPEIAVDPDQMQQVVLNLLKNAVEASPDGATIHVTVEERVERDRPIAALVIEDAGPGIEATALPHIFEPFFTRGKAEGTGLGLYVSHGIVERHGGELIAENRIEGGARFTVKLPLTELDSTETAA